MGDEVAADVLEALVDEGQWLSVAESLTGGLVAAEITGAPGASRAFRGSVTAYATRVKRDLLGVDGALLDEGGAVQAEVARQMAAGVRRLMGTEWGMATTGVAGPEPQDGAPVGTVYIAVAGPGTQPAVAELLKLDGGRKQIRNDTVRASLELLRARLAEHRTRLTGEARAKFTEHGGGFDAYSPE